MTQVKALVATLPVCLKILDVAGSAAGIYTFEPSSADNTSPSRSTTKQAAAAVRPSSSSRPWSDMDVQRLWLIYRPGHYEVVYPNEGSENLEKL